jgi:hypothetical protein
VLFVDPRPTVEALRTVATEIMPQFAAAVAD